MNTTIYAYQVCTFKERGYTDLEVTLNKFLENEVDEGKLVDIKYSCHPSDGHNKEFYTAMVIYYGKIR